MTNAAVAHHEAGHAVATVAAFRMARRRPAVLVRRLEITNGGHCVSMSSPRMRSQIAIHLAGGLAESIHRGVPCLEFAVAHCGMAVDLMRAKAVAARCTGTLAQHADDTLALLEASWPAVTALATVLLEAGRIEGGRVEEIVVAAVPGIRYPFEPIVVGTNGRSDAPRQIPRKKGPR